MHSLLDFSTAQRGRTLERSLLPPNKLLATAQEVERRVSNDAPFIGGQAPCAADFAVAPRLYLAREGARLLLVTSRGGGVGGPALRWATPHCRRRRQQLQHLSSFVLLSPPLLPSS